MESEFNLISLFGEISDPRIDRKKLHRLGDILVISILAVICGAESWIDIEDFGSARYEWLKEFLELPNGIPSHDTFNRVFSLIDSNEFEKRFAEWVRVVSGKLNGQIAIDGKMIKGSGNRRKGEEPLWIVSAWATDLNLVLAETQVAKKSNEITAIPKILEMLSLNGCIVSIDAMGCQKEIAQDIKERSGEYVLALKGNQGRLHAEVVNFFDQAEMVNFECLKHDCHTSYEKNRGREETRILYVTEEIDWLPYREQWQGLRSIVCMISKRTVAGRKSTERRYYISSLPADSQQHAKAIRNHWSIENKQHWVLDVGFNEDRCRIRDRTAGKNLATLRRMALNLLKQEPTKAGIRRKRLRAGWDDKFLRSVVT